MKQEDNEGSLITGDITVVHRWLHEGKLAVLPFGRGRMYGLFGIEHKRSLSRMIRIKGREKGKPFVVTTHPAYIENILNHKGISDTLSSKDKLRLYDFLTHGSSEHSVGVLVPANSKKLHPNLKGSIVENGTIVPTLGIMMSGPDSEYYRCISGLEKHSFRLAGTSMNKSKDKKSRGSAHHLLSGVIRQFGHEKDLCIYIPRYFVEHHGVSTTIVYINPAYSIAILVRIGSISYNQTVLLLKKSGIKNIIHPTLGVKHIRPYYYSTKEKLSMWLHHKYLVFREHIMKDIVRNIKI